MNLSFINILALHSCCNRDARERENEGVIKQPSIHESFRFKASKTFNVTTNRHAITILYLYSLRW
jgi:hypothetical protein